MHTDRIAKVRKELLSNSASALLVTDFYNILYLTGFKTFSPEVHEAYLLITQKSVTLFTDRRYKPSFENTVYFSKEKGLASYLEEISQKEKIKAVAVEGHSLTVAEYESLKQKVPKLQIVSTSEVVRQVRQIKEPDEIECVRRAAELTGQCLKDVILSIKPGKKEMEIALEIEYWAKSRGHELAFFPIVASDKGSALPHHDNSGVISRNSLILIDMGIKYRNYCSDMSRVFVLGYLSDKQRSAYEKLLKVQEATLKKIKKGASTKEIDAFCRGTVVKAGLPDFSHATGHGIGLEVHEKPTISYRSDAIMQKNQVYAVEPGAYYEGEFGMRVEDTVLVTETGYEILTKFSKELRIL